MKILILGGDGYLGWPTAMYLSQRGHEVAVLDNFAKRRWEMELNVEPLTVIRTLQDRVRAWHEVSGLPIRLFIGDLRNYEFVEKTLRAFRPDAIVHYGEQPSAPYSMLDHNRAVFSQMNNVQGTLNLLWAIRDVVPESHLVKLGTMGEYGTPNIDIEEGFIEIVHKGRRDLLPFPCQPGSFYHLSKVHDSHNIRFACRTWGLRSTDLNQGVVYGIQTELTRLDARLETSFHYDNVFGTALNRFCVQAVAGIPLTVYGTGGQQRGFLLNPVLIVSWASSSSVLKSLQTAYGQIEMLDAVPADTKIAVRASNSAVSVPASVLLKRGEQRLSFPITASAVRQSTDVTITLSQGEQEISTRITVSP